MLSTADVLQAVMRHSWFMSIDLKDMYFHVPIALHHRQYLRFAFESKAYQFKVLPFGLSLAPRVFRREQAEQDTAVLLRHMTQLGLTIYYAKSCLIPNQRVVFIGLTLDSHQMLAFPTPRRRRRRSEVPQIQEGQGVWLMPPCIAATERPGISGLASRGGDDRCFVLQLGGCMAAQSGKGALVGRHVLVWSHNKMVVYHGHISAGATECGGGMSASCMQWSSDGTGVALWPNPSFLLKKVAPAHSNQVILLAAYDPSGLQGLRGVPLHEICAAATWATPCTFARFYRVNVATPHAVAAMVFPKAIPGTAGWRTVLELSRVLLRTLPMSICAGEYSMPVIVCFSGHSAENQADLSRHRITHILNAAHSKRRGQPDIYEGMNITYMGIEAHDSCSFNMSVNFQAAADFIHRALSRGAVVCVGSGHHHEGHDQDTALNSSADSVSLLAAHAESQGKNIFFSPASLSIALAALSVGARGETHRQLFSGLGFNSSLLTQTVVDQSFRTLLQRANKTSQDISEGTAVFVDNHFKPQPEFLDVLKQSYFADGFEVDFTKSTDSADTINKYVEEKTNGKIDKLVESLDPSTVMYLVSYIFYKDTLVPVQMMNMERQFDTYYDQAINTSVLHLPFNNSYSMLLLLPDDMATLENVICPSHVTKWLKGMKSRTYEVYIPKFSIKTSYSLKDILIEMGMTDMFGDRADLSGISEETELLVSEVQIECLLFNTYLLLSILSTLHLTVPPFYPQVVHKAALDVDEAGATATAVTGMVIIKRLMIIYPVLKFNRPFMVLITEHTTENILFMGKIINPNI
eukprot:superscaffoldBa00000965_g8254